MSESPTLDAIEQHDRNDFTLTRVMVELHRDSLRHVLDGPGKGTWHRWLGGRWRRDITGIETRCAWKSVVAVRRAVVASTNASLVRWTVGAGNDQRLKAMVRLAASAPELVIERLRMDTNPRLLAVGNGVLDLDTLTLREPSPDDLITRGTDVPYRADAPAPTWRKFLSDVFHGDERLIAYVQRVAGYILQGENPEQVFFVFMGAGRNGKGAIVRALHKVLGTLALDANFSTFCGRNPDAGAPRPDLVRLAGSRVVTVGEGRKSEPLNSALVKALTGGDHVTVRDLYAGEITYVPQFTLLFHTNALPETDATDDAFWRRARVVPFEVSFDPDVPALHHMPDDPTVEARIADELPGVLAWAVEGLRKWSEQGLDPTPDAVLAATRRRRSEDDPFALFIDEAEDLPGPGEKVAKAELRRQFEQWCKSNGVFPIPSPQMFGRLAARNGFAPSSARLYIRQGGDESESERMPF